VGTIPLAEWNLRDLVWHGSGDILLTTDNGLYRLPEDGGEVTLVVAADKSRRETFLDLSLLSDNRILMSISDSTGDHLAVIEPRSWLLTRVAGQGGGRFTRGWLFRGSATGVVAVRFDEKRLSATGEPVAIVGTPGSVRAPVVSAGGSLAWFSTQTTPRELVSVDRSGREGALAVPPLETLMRWPRISPQGDRLAFGSESGRPLVVFNLFTGNRTSLPNSKGDTEPVWMPDGSGIISSTGTIPNQGLVLHSADGTTSTILAQPNFEAWPTSVSRDGDLLLYYVSGSGGDHDDLYVMDIKSRKSTRVGCPGAKGARFSPDGRRIACQAIVEGRYEVEVMPWPNPELRRVVSSEGGTEPIWSADGRELFFRSGDRVMVAQVLPGSEFATAPPKALFSFPYLHDKWGDQSWDLAPDKRFLMLKPTATAPVEVRMIRNAVGQLEQGTVVRRD
jgi:hypothetical protein